MIANNINQQTLEEAAMVLGLRVEIQATSGSGRRFRVKVSPGEERDEEGDRKYQRISASMGRERRVAAVCWHGFRDFFRECFAIEPEASFKTAIDHWKGSEDFEERYQASGRRNAGSMMYPISHAEACRCPESGCSV